MQRHERISKLFLEACELRPEERKAFLERACAGEPELLEEVESLLANDDEARRFLQTGGGANEHGALATTELVDETDADSHPEHIGAFRILQTIGEGGMGIVYLAEQERPVRRQVALKLIKVGMDTRQIVARFESERQALALMNHPNIARVFDGGATDRGRPYFAMEYVKGEPITTYCDRHQLDTRERLELFCQVCDGVQHAHQKGIIHRDIKASNVLVAIHDGKPVPKLIDFGIAKATQQRLTEKTMFTQLGVLIGTPEYMSPEQAEMSGLDIDTRTDVYSLGVLLYELLVGALPFDSHELRRAAFGEIARTIRESQPPLPSKRLSTLDDLATDSARNRRSEPAALIRRLRGDLDWVTMKALDKDRTRRYASPSEFAADVRRHLQHEPVLASPPSPTYRARKFLRRHRLGVSAAAAVVLALVVGIVGTAVGLVRATRAETEARREAATVEQVSEFLVGLFEVSSPSEARGNTVTAREILDVGAARIETEMVAQPFVQARLMHTMGSVYNNLGLFREAERLVERSRGLQRELLGDADPNTLRNTNTLAAVLWGQGRYDEAESLYAETRETSIRVRGEDDPIALLATQGLVQVYYSQIRFEEAAALGLETLEATRRIFGEDHRFTLMLRHKVAMAYMKLRRFDESEQLLLDVLEASRRVGGTDHPDTVDALANLGLLYDDQGRFEDAEPVYLEALELMRKVYGRDNWEVVTLLGYLATLYQNLGRMEEAEPIYVEVLEEQGRMLGEEHAETILSTINLAVLYCRQGRFGEAEPLLVESLETSRRALGPEHPQTLLAADNLGKLCEVQGRLDEAARLYEEAVETKRRVLPASHPSTLHTFGNLARLYAITNRPESARRLVADQLTRMHDAAVAPDATAEAKGAYARLALSCEPSDLQDPASALPLAAEAAEMTDFKNTGLLATHALAYHRTGQTAQAIETQRKALALLPEGDSGLRRDLEAALAEFEAER